MKHTVQSTIKAGYNTAYFFNDVNEGASYQPRALNLRTGSADLAETDIGLRNSGSHFQVFLGDNLAKRKYDDMTSSGIQEVEAENIHESSSKLSFLRENKKRRPPKVGNFMEVQGEHDVKLRALIRSDSALGIGLQSVTPEICGDSDLTAENHMAEGSSRSSNNGGSSGESAAESVPKGQTRKFESVSSSDVLHSGVLQCFLDQSDGGKHRDVTEKPSAAPSHPSILDKNDDYSTSKEMNDRNDDVGAGKLTKSEWTTRSQRESGCTEAPSSDRNAASQLWGRSNPEWLQLGLGSSREGASSKQSELEPPASAGRPPSFRQGNQGRNCTKRKCPESIEFPIVENLESEHNHCSIFTETPNLLTPVHWQGGRSFIERTAEISLDRSKNPATFPSLQSSSFRTNGVAESLPNCDVYETDLCLFGSNIVTSSSPQLLLAHPSEPCTAKLCVDLPRSEKDQLVSTVATGLIVDDTFVVQRDQDSQSVIFPARNEDFASSGLGRSGVYNLGGARFSSIPAEHVQFNSGQAGIQFHRHSGQPSSLTNLMQTREDQRQTGYSWLSPTESAHKLIPVANNFQGWSSDLTSSSKPATFQSVHGQGDRHSNLTDQQVQRASDEWGSLFRRVSPNMVFQPHCQFSAEGSSAGGMLKSTGVENTNVSNEAQDNLVAIRHAIDKIQKRPQWTSLEQSNLGSVASWCLNGQALQGGRQDAKVEHFSGIGQPLFSSMVPGRVPVHSRFAGDNILNPRTLPLQRQSWQPGGTPTNLHHGNVNVLKRPKSAAEAEAKFQVFPPGSRGTSRAGLWFILQSAENQNGEVGLPQISKCYLRIKDGKTPVSAVKKYLVTKLGLSNESEVEITCKGQPVVPSLPLEHVRDVIWFSSLNAKRTMSCEEKDITLADHHLQGLRPPTNLAAGAAKFSKDVLMVLTYRRHPRALLSTLLT